MKNYLLPLLLFCTLNTFAQKEKKLVDKAEDKIEANDTEGAIKLLDKAIEANDQYVRAYNLRAEIYGKKLMHDKAIQDYSASLNIDNNQEEIHFKRGREYMKLHDMDNAIKDFSKVIDINPKRKKAYVNRGECYSKKGMKSAACDDWTKAAEMGDKNAKALLSIKCKE